MDTNTSPAPKTAMQMTPEERRAMWIELSDMKAEDLQQLWADLKARQSNVPKVGSEAPDFTIDRLDAKKKRTGDTVTLSALRGKPVALIFGSYT